MTGRISSVFQLVHHLISVSPKDPGIGLLILDLLFVDIMIHLNHDETFEEVNDFSGVIYIYTCVFFHHGFGHIAFICGLYTRHKHTQNQVQKFDAEHQ